jgi:hypothetical protein
MGNTGADLSLAVVADGYLVGVIGYINSLLHQRKRKHSERAALQYGMSPKYSLRLGRLLTRIGLCRSTLSNVLTPAQLIVCSGIATTQLSQYPESKEMRGLMKLEKREKPYKHRLVYHADISESTWQESYNIWFKDEQRYLKARQ